VAETTISRSDDCSSGIHEFCNRCQCECHGHELSQVEINALWRIIKHQYISYEDLEASAIASRIAKIAVE
jgi:hypothetical protein